MAVGFNWDESWTGICLPSSLKRTDVGMKNWQACGYVGSLLMVVNCRCLGGIATLMMMFGGDARINATSVEKDDIQHKQRHHRQVSRKSVRVGGPFTEGISGSLPSGL